MKRDIVWRSPYVQSLRWTYYAVLQATGWATSWARGLTVDEHVQDSGTRESRELRAELDDMVNRLEHANIWWIREYQRRRRLAQAIEFHREALGPMRSDTDMQLYRAYDEVMTSEQVEDDRAMRDVRER